jgi:hypothetical protein
VSYSWRARLQQLREKFPAGVPGADDEDFGWGVGVLKQPRARVTKSIEATTAKPAPSEIFRRRSAWGYMERRVTCRTCKGNPPYYVQSFEDYAAGKRRITNCVRGCSRGAKWIPEKEMECVK